MNEARNITDKRAVAVPDHTPGPWRFDGDWSRIPTIFGADGIKVASVEKDRVWDGWVRELPSRKANARLIAAAPDMLEALKAMRVASTLQCASRVNKKLGKSADEKFAEAFNLTTDAIAKAEGRS